MKRRLLSLILCLTFLASISPMYVNAAIKGNPNNKVKAAQKTKQTVNRYEIAGIDNPKAFEASFNKVKNLVAKGNKAAVANYINYPLNVNHNGHTDKIKTKKEFIKNYDKIMTPEVKKALTNQEVQKTFVNYQGVMVNNGELWFNQCGKNKYRIIAVNN